MRRTRRMVAAGRPPRASGEGGDGAEPCGGGGGVCVINEFMGWIQKLFRWDDSQGRGRSREEVGKQVESLCPKYRDRFLD